MRRVKSDISHRLYLCIFALVEGSRVDKYVRRAISLLHPKEHLEDRVKYFYLETLKQYLGFLLLSIILGVCVDDTRFRIMLCICLLVGMLAPFWDLRLKLIKRRESLRREYGQMIIKLLMYIGAGMSLRNAFEYVAKDLSMQRKESMLMNEMFLCLRWLGSGQIETECYYRFGQRCDLPEYLRLGGLLAQNVRRGNSELLNILEKEMTEVEELYRHRIRREGEKVSTKLLGPMMIMLSMVMVMIMIPAFGSL